LPASQLDESREYFSEALDVARAAQDEEEFCLVSTWWASREADAGSLERAIALASDALACAGTGTQSTLEIGIAGWALALGRFEEAKPHALRAFALAQQTEIPLARTLTMAYAAPYLADPRSAAMVFGFAKAHLAELEWEPGRDDLLALESAARRIESGLEHGEYESLLQRGCALTRDRALALLSEVSTPAGTSSYAGPRS
jgi:hypothetical protein